MSSIAIRVQDVAKRYRIGRPPVAYRTIREALSGWLCRGFRARSPIGHADARTARAGATDSFWALRDVAFDVGHGEVVGVIGHNGAGKSTLLKILARITEPSCGRVEIRGRVASLLEVGTGFHPELTGRENIYLNGAILGMKRAEIRTKFDEIVAFAEVERFLDTPVKHYSSGMYMRLAFAVAAHRQPEILLVDEVLAVGDASFQKRCIGKMGEVAKDGRTVLFVSHNMAAVQNLCDRSVLLEGGRIAAEGKTAPVIDKYLQRAGTTPNSQLTSHPRRSGSGLLRWNALSFRRRDGSETSVFLSGEDCFMRLAYTAACPLPSGARLLVAVGVQDCYGQTLFLCSNELTGEIGYGWPRSGEVICHIPHLPLASGCYSVNLYVAANGEPADWITGAGTFQVENADFFGTGRLPPASHGQFLLRHSWTVEGTEPAVKTAGLSCS